MSTGPSDLVPFGKTYAYDHRARLIYVTRYNPFSQETIALPDYTRLINGRRRLAAFHLTYPAARFRVVANGDCHGEARPFRSSVFQ